MKYKITSHISQQEVKLLKKLENKIINNIFYDSVGEFSLNVIIDSSNEKIVIKNCPIVELDGDEYPKLVIEECKIKTNDYSKIMIGKPIKNIFVIRDKATWNNNNWIINSDIGIKLVLDDNEWLFIAYDSLAGFIKIIELKEYKNGKNTFLKNYWIMKTDILESLRREKISLDLIS